MSAAGDERRARVAEFVGRSDKMCQNSASTSHWAQQHQSEHSELVERAKATVSAGHVREAEDRTKFDELYGIKMVVDLNDKDRIHELRARYSKEKSTTEEAPLAAPHPHYHFGTLAHPLDIELNTAHRYPYHHRHWLTSETHHFANLRDTRDVMEREGPLLENRAKDHYVATQAFMHTAIDRAISFEEEQAAAAKSIAAQASLSGIPDYYATAGPVTSARGLEEASHHANHMNNNQWGQQLGADQSWLMANGH